jgi:DNA-directed RNA polymerase specialized sigma24 family protein
VLSDDELVEQILLGNENAAEELIKRYYTSILRYCRWHCSNLEKDALAQIENITADNARLVSNLHTNLAILIQIVISHWD